MTSRLEAGICQACMVGLGEIPPAVRIPLTVIMCEIVHIVGDCVHPYDRDCNRGKNLHLNHWCFDVANNEDPADRCDEGLG